LTTLGPYTNDATVTGTTVDGTPLSLTSNQVVVEVLLPPFAPPPGPHSAAGPAANNPAGAAAKPSSHRVLARCEASRPALHGASGAKHGVFTLQIASKGIKQITFYLDGRRLKAFSQAQARHGQFSLQVDPRKLSYGAHRLSITTVMSNPNCARVALAHVFVHARTERIAPKFTG
jgi:hypothetical protein